MSTNLRRFGHPPLEALLAPRSQTGTHSLWGDDQAYPDLVSVVELSTASQPGSRWILRRTAPDQRCYALIACVLSTGSSGRLRDNRARLEKTGDGSARRGVSCAAAETVSHYGDDCRRWRRRRHRHVRGRGSRGGSRARRGQPDSETRRLWLEALLEAELTDIDWADRPGPQRMGRPLEHATDTDWTWIEKRVRAEIQKSGDWAREALVIS